MCDFPLRIRRFQPQIRVRSGLSEPYRGRPSSLCPHEYALHLAVPEPVHVVLDERHRRATKHKCME